MSNKQFTRRLLDEGDYFEGELEDGQPFHRAKGQRFKHKNNKPKREKPEWKKIKDDSWD